MLGTVASGTALADISDVSGKIEATDAVHHPSRRIPRKPRPLFGVRRGFFVVV